MTTSHRLEKVVAKVGDLPAMPEIVAKVMEVTSDPNVSVSDVSDLIEQDPAMTAKLLKVSNSSYYGMRQVVGSLKLALVILGVREVRNIVLGISVFESLRTKATETLLTNKGLWTHSVQVAGVAKMLSGHLELRMQGEDFIAGLLHDIGKLILWGQMGDDYQIVYERAHELGVPLSELEYQTFDFDHADAAGALAQTWNLPASLSGAIECHHAREDRVLGDTESPRLASLIRIANQASHENWGDVNGEDEIPSHPSCEDEEAWRLLAHDSEPPAPAGRAELLKSFVMELNQSPSLAL